MGCDAWLAQRLASGDPTAMELLISRYGERLRRTIGQLTAWGPDVDDLLQETLIRAWKHAASFRSDGTFEKWLISIAFRVCRDHHRGIRRMMTRLQQFGVTRRGDNKMDRIDVSKAIPQIVGIKCNPQCKNLQLAIERSW